MNINLEDFKNYENISIDFEFFTGDRQTALKQVGIIFFNDNHRQIAKYERTMVQKKDETEVKYVIENVIKNEELQNIFIWGGSQDLKLLRSMDVDMSLFMKKIVDIQPLFNVHKGNSNTLEQTYIKIFGVKPQGCHNALIDAVLLSHLALHFNLNDKKAYNALKKYHQMLYMKTFDGNLKMLKEKEQKIKEEDEKKTSWSKGALQIKESQYQDEKSAETTTTLDSPIDDFNVKEKSKEDKEKSLKDLDIVMLFDTKGVKAKDIKEDTNVIAPIFQKEKKAKKVKKNKMKVDNSEVIIEDTKKDMEKSEMNWQNLEKIVNELDKKEYTKKKVAEKKYIHIISFSKDNYEQKLQTLVETFGKLERKSNGMKLKKIESNVIYYRRTSRHLMIYLKD